MNPDLMNALANFINLATETLKGTSNFVIGQLPALLQEKVIMGRVEETLTKLMQLSFATIFLYLAFKPLWKWALKWADESDGFSFAIPLIVGIGGFVFTSTFLFDSHDFIMVWFAPKLYLMNWLIQTAKSIKG